MPSPEAHAAEAEPGRGEDGAVCPAGFNCARQGSQVWVSADGLDARHLDDSSTGDVMRGVLLGATPLKAGRAGLYFEVQLVEVRPDACYDGLTVGVTATPPDAVEENPPTAEHVPVTWAVGYDGQMWDAATECLSPVGWDPRRLQPGDSVGVLVTHAEGELLVFRNGAACCAGPRGIPVSSDSLYAVVDLLGSARAVRWVPGAQPPVGAHPSRSKALAPQVARA